MNHLLVKKLSLDPHNFHVVSLEKKWFFLFFLRAFFFWCYCNLYHETMEISKKRQILLMIYYSRFVLIYFSLEKIWILFKSFEWIIFSELNETGMKEDVCSLTKSEDTFYGSRWRSSDGRQNRQENNIELEQSLGKALA